MFLNGATSSVSLSRARAPSFVSAVRLQRVPCSARGAKVRRRIDAASNALQPGGGLERLRLAGRQFYDGLSGSSSNQLLSSMSLPLGSVDARGGHTSQPEQCQTPDSARGTTLTLALA